MALLSALVDRFSSAFLVGAIFAVLGLVASLTLIRRDELEPQILRTREEPAHSSRPSVRGMMVEPSEVTDMDLYLMQHGQATTETEDRERPLTDAGRAAVQRVAKRARAAGVRISGCLHSGKLRAEQTAQLLVTEVHQFVVRFFSLIERRILVINQRG